MKPTLAVLTSVLCLSGCYVDAVDVWIEDPTEEREAIVAEALMLWGYTPTFVGTEFGALRISWEEGTFHSPVGPAVGFAKTRPNCKGKQIWTNEDVTILAHELGHAFGLRHHSDCTEGAQNLMCNGFIEDGYYITEEQEARFHRSVSTFFAFC